MKLKVLKVVSDDAGVVHHIIFCCSLFAAKDTHTVAPSLSSVGALLPRCELWATASASWAAAGRPLFLFSLLNFSKQCQSQSFVGSDHVA